MAQAYLSASPCFSLLNAAVAKFSGPCALLQLPNSSSSSSRISSGFASPFMSGSPLDNSFRTASRKRKLKSHAMSVSIRCEQGAKERAGVDVWLSRLAMVGFATTVTVEIATGKGLLENFGFVSSIPTLALAVTALVGVLTAFFIFQSASRD